MHNLQLYQIIVALDRRIPSPAEPLKPEMKALRSSECAGYSLKSSGENVQYYFFCSFLVDIHTLVLAGHDENLYIVLWLLQQLP